MVTSMNVSASYGSVATTNGKFPRLAKQKSQIFTYHLPYLLSIQTETISIN